MQALGWLIAAGFAVAILWLVVLASRARARRAEALLLLTRLEQEQNRMLQGLILAQEAASRILTPGELAGTVGRIAREAVDLLGVEGACVFVRPPEGTDEPTDLCAGHFPDGMADPSLPTSETDVVPGFGSILTIPIRLGTDVLGEFRLAERAGRTLNVREIHVAQLLAQLIAIAAQYRIQRNAIERAEEDKRRFILATTHDLRAPVTTIEQLAQTMREGYAGEIPEKPRELIEKIHGRAEQLLELLGDLLNLAAEQQDIGVMREKVPVSLSAIFDAQIEAARVACETRGIELSAHRPGIALTRMAAKGDLEKILSNLLSNAAKYTLPGDGSTLDLRTPLAGSSSGSRTRESGSRRMRSRSSSRSTSAPRTRGRWSGTGRASASRSCSALYGSTAGGSASIASSTAERWWRFCSRRNERG